MAKQQNVVIENLVDILKSFGACDLVTNEELARDQIEQAIDLNDSVQIRESIRKAVWRQLDHDRNNENMQDRELAYDFHAAKQVLLDNNVFKRLNVRTKGGKNLTAEDLCTKLFERQRLNYDNTVDTLLAGAIAGIPERQQIKDASTTLFAEDTTETALGGIIKVTPGTKNLKQKEAEATAEKLTAVLGDVVLDGYQEFLKAHPDLTPETFSPADYKEVKNQLNVAQAMIDLIGDEKTAMQILNQPLTADSAAMHNAALSGNYAAASQARQARGARGALAGVTNDGQVRVLDLLMTVSQNITKVQVQAFCEQRATEQDKVGEQRLGLEDPTRLTNTFGHAGRETVENLIDGQITKKMVPATKVTDGASLPDHAWRGYTKLANLITQTVKRMYGAVQTGEFVSRLLSKKTASEGRGPKDLRWEIKDYAVMPDAYRDKQGNLNAAGEFFERTQARLMADKVKIEEYKLKVQAAPKDQDAAAQLQYYTYRARLAADALDNVAAATKGDKDLLNDQAYFQQLDNQIVMVASPDYPHTEQLLDNDAVAAMALQDENRTNEEYWVDALQTFKNHNDQAPATAENDASYRMLAEMFSLGNRYGKDITKSDLANLMQNVANGPFNPKKVEQFIKGLTAKPGSKYAITATDCRNGLHQAATAFLAKVKYQDAYANYELSAQATQ